MTLRPEQRKSALALSAYLKTVHEAVLAAALADLGVTVPVERAAASKPRLCKTCGKSYPVCRQLWADDHEFEAPAPPQQRDGQE